MSYQPKLLNTDIVSRVRFRIIKANFKIKHILDQINPYVVVWSDNQRESFATSIIYDRYNPVWDEEIEFTLIRSSKYVKMIIYGERLYPKYNPLISPIKIDVGEIGDHITYDGPIYLDDEEVGTFNYEIDFLPLEYSEEIEEKYKREMEKEQREAEEVERQKEEERRKEEERKREEEKRKEEEKNKPGQKMVPMPYKRITRPRKDQDERDWEWARKYYS